MGANVYDAGPRSPNIRHPLEAPPARFVGHVDVSGEDATFICHKLVGFFDNADQAVQAAVRAFGLARAEHPGRLIEARVLCPAGQGERRKQQSVDRSRPHRRPTKMHTGGR